MRSDIKAASLAVICYFAVLAAPCDAGGRAAGGDSIVGLWSNPEHSIVVRTDETGSTLSGRIVWASDAAIADASDSGVTGLIGTELLEDYHPDGPHRWKGIVYVPDMGHRFTSFISQPRPDMLKISGCVLGGLFCRSQVWRRNI